MQPFSLSRVLPMYPHAMEAHPDRERVALAQKDPEAFGVLFDTYHDAILRYCIHRTGDVEIGRDLAANTFYKAMKQLWRFRWQGIPFSSWLYRIATNEIASYARGRRTSPLQDLLDQGIEPADHHDIREELIAAQTAMERHAQFLAVRAELATLPIHYQEVIALRFFEEKTVLEVAQIVGKREGTVKSLLSRGLAKLRVRLQPSTETRVIHVKVERYNSLDGV